MNISVLAAEDELKENNPDIKTSSQPVAEDEVKTEKSKSVPDESESESKANATENVANKTEAQNEKNTTIKEDVDPKPKVVLLKEPIESQIHILAVPELTGDQLDESINKFVKLFTFQRFNFQFLFT